MKRTLRPSIRFALETITMFLGICLVSINDFTLGAIPVILLVIAIIIANVKILEKF